MGLIVYGGETQSANPQEVKVRKDNDFKLIFLVERNGNPEDMSKATIVSLNLISPSGIVSLSPVSIKDNIIYLDIDSTLNQVLGKYNLELKYTVSDIEFTGGVRDCAVDVYAYTIVATSSEATRIDELAKTVDVATGFQGKAFTFGMYTPEQIAELQSPALEAAQAASIATQNALDATAGAITAKNAANTATQEANTATDHANAAATLAHEEAGKATVATQQAGAAASDAFQKAEAAAQAATIAGQAAINADNTRQALSQSFAVELAYAEQKLLEIEQAKTQTIGATESSISATAEATRQGNLAEDASIRANDAAGNADQARALLVETSDVKMGQVDEKIQEANTAISNANAKAAEANNAAGLANDAAALANTKAGLANDAAGSANEAATTANTAAGLADTARTELTTAVNTKLGEADGKIEEMNTTLSTYDGRVTQVESDIVQLAGEVSQKASHGYVSNPKTLKQVDDDLALRELKANKQNSLSADGTGTKFPTVDAVNAGLVANSNLLYQYVHSGNKEVYISAIDYVTHTFTSVGHGLANGDRITHTTYDNGQMEKVFPFALNYPVDLTGWYVINANADTFQISATSGGSAVATIEKATQDFTKWRFEVIKSTNMSFENIPALGCNIEIIGNIPQVPKFIFLDGYNSPPSTGYSQITSTISASATFHFLGNIHRGYYFINLMKTPNSMAIIRKWGGFTINSATLMNSIFGERYDVYTGNVTSISKVYLYIMYLNNGTIINILKR